MKLSDLLFVVTADQRHSRSSPDRVPSALEHLDPISGKLAFERTAGDEIQGLLADPADVVAVTETLTRLGDWRLGIGIGRVETPLPDSTRKARGPAYVAARAAIGDAHRSPTGLALRLAEQSSGEMEGEETVTPLPYGDELLLAADAEAALWMLRALWQRRTEEGWEIVDLLAQEHTNASAAALLGITPSAVSQRLGHSYLAETDRGAALTRRLLAGLLGNPS